MTHLMLHPISSEAEKETSSEPAAKAVFKAILPEEIDWKPFAAFPPSVRLAVVVGHPSPEDRVYTVISGIFYIYIGLGDQFDAEKLQAYPPGAVFILPGNTSHFHWAKSGEYVTQVSAIGPLGLEYVNAHDDPRNGSSEE